MIPPRYGLAAVAIVGVVAAWRRPALRPVAAALVALLGLDLVYHFKPHPRATLAAWLAWPLVSAALSWHVWGRTGKGWALGAAAVLLASLAPWRAHPLAYAVATHAPFLIAPCLSTVAWSAAMPSRDRAVVAARRCAALLAWSGFVDVVVGALAPGATYDAAAPLAWVTWAAIGGVLGWEAARGARGA